MCSAPRGLRQNEERKDRCGPGHLPGRRIHPFGAGGGRQGKETFIDLEGFGKGVVFVNGHHCGRFYEAGPTLSLYIPGPFLKKGINQIIIFETEGCYRDKIELIGQPKYL